MDNMEKLTATLNDYQKKLFDNYCDAQGDIEGITRYDTYTTALIKDRVFQKSLLYIWEPPLIRWRNVESVASVAILTAL